MTKLSIQAFNLKIPQNSISIMLVKWCFNGFGEISEKAEISLYWSPVLIKIEGDGY